MKYKNIALNLYSNGANCSQSVLGTMSEYLGIDESVAYKISSPFGGGVCRQGEICGAVSGALMAIGLKEYPDSKQGSESKGQVYELSQKFICKFKDKHNSIICRELLGYDLSSPEERKKASQSGVFSELCPKLIESAVDILLNEIFSDK